MKLTRIAGAVCAGAAVVTAALVAAPAASAAPAAPKDRAMKLVDNCDKPSWDAAFGPAFCLVDAGGVTPAQFAAAVPNGGDGNWWINNRTETIKEGDRLVIDNVGGETHTFTQVDHYGVGLGFFNDAVPGAARTDAETGGQVGALGVNEAGKATAVVPRAGLSGIFFPDTKRDTLVVTGLKAQKDPYLFQCVIHPWMRTKVFVQSNT